MSDFLGGARNPASSESPLDQFGALAAALRDSWALGMSAVEKALAQGVEGIASGDPAAATGDLGKQAEMVSLVAQSYVIAATSGLRYLSRVAQTCGAHQTGILSSFMGPAAGRQFSEQDRRALAENIRACLREVGDVAQQEARILQAELEKVGEGLARAADEVETTPAHQRHWKVKP
jgi:uncharacterized membrane protein